MLCQSSRAHDEVLDRDAENAEKQKAAVAHVVENLFPYAPVKVQTQTYPRDTPKAGQAYLWITVDEEAIKRRGASTDTPLKYPVGVAVDAEGNVFVSEAGGHSNGGSQPGSPSSAQSYTITAASIVSLANTKAPPPALKPPSLVEATQTSLLIKWKRASDSTVDRYELQYRRADSPNSPWSALATSNVVKNVALDNLKCHTSYEFRVRAHNPIGCGEYSEPSDILWTLPGIPSTPQPPIAGAVVNTYVSMFWAPVDNNGAPPVVYFLEVREQNAGSGSFRQIYEGTGTGFVVTGLNPRTAYIFRLQASNVIGSTPFVESRAIKTLAHGKPEIVELPSSDETAISYSDRWVQCWDPVTEKVFFFNKYTSQRVTTEPREVAEAREKIGVKDVDQTPDMVFRRKRFHFHRELRKGMEKNGASSTSSSGSNSFGATMPLELQRESMFENTVSAFERLGKKELVAKPKITFVNEPGIDSGGLTKDWFLQVSHLATEKKHGIFKLCDQGWFEIDPASAYDPKRLQLYRFVGKFIAKAIFDRQTLDLPVYEVFYKHLLRIVPTMEDLHKIDAQFHKSLQWMLDNSVLDVIDETFSVEVEVQRGSGQRPSSMIIDLKENGRDIPVTDTNKHEYVDLVVKWRLDFGIRPQLDAIFQGIGTLIPIERLQCFAMDELRMLVNGKPTIEVEELRANTVFQGGYNEHSQVVLWLWQALREFPLELRGHFLKFMTGTNKIPLDGFEPPLNITKSDLDPLALPRTHTCFNQLVLPEYQSYEVLVDKIRFAITNAEGFELS